MLRYIKRFIVRTLAHFGYYLVKEPPGQFKGAPQPSSELQGQLPADLVAALPEIIRRLQPPGQPPVEGYQLEMATYHLKTGMGDVEPDFFPLYERCRQYTMTCWRHEGAVGTVVSFIRTTPTPKKSIWTTMPTTKINSSPTDC